MEVPQVIAIPFGLIALFVGGKLSEGLSDRYFNIGFDFRSGSSFAKISADEAPTLYKICVITYTLIFLIMLCGVALALIEPDTLHFLLSKFGLVPH